MEPVKKKIISSILAISILTSYLPGLTNFEIIPVSKAAAPTTVWEYNYTGSYQTFTAQYGGTYRIELYGAQAGTADRWTNHSPRYIEGGKGAYVSGDIKLEKGTQLTIAVGERGGDAVSVAENEGDSWGTPGRGGWPDGAVGNYDKDDEKHGDQNGGGQRR